MSTGVPVDYTIDVVWQGESRYSGGRRGGPALLLDGSAAEAPTPVDSLLVALASCSAVDIVEILEKRRTPVKELSVAVEFSRAAEHPRRIIAVKLRFRVATASERAHVERAITLSFEKYCSVAATMAPDMALEWELELVPAP